MGWPHKADGTVDWDSVFEDKEIGLVPYAERAKTVRALGQCAHVIVQSLFIRAEDGKARMAFNAAIDELVHLAEKDGHMDDARHKLLALLREVKGNRQKYAQHFLDAEREDEERRRGDYDPAEDLSVLKH